ncbi:unnamed protein product [Echinostoma caproni]|uniref:TPR_REGION domain-containing protein n=1 Tax=Echinostoma caproni TaxID=27848 RepID=A0A182ZZX9_9TREM|nr:unnamed protein product [Echinostoma caproni]
MEDYASAIGSYRSALALIQCNEFDLTVDSESDQPIATDPPPDEGMGSPEKEREQELQEKTQMKSTHAVAVTLRHSMLPHLIRLYFQYYQSFLRAGSKQEAQVQLRQVGSLTNEYCLADQSNTDSRTFTPGHLIILKPMIEFYRNDECDRMEGLHILNHAIQFLESNAEIDENFAKLIEKLREDGTFVIIPGKVRLASFLKISNWVLH